MSTVNACLANDSQGQSLLTSLTSMRFLEERVSQTFETYQYYSIYGPTDRKPPLYDSIIPNWQSRMAMRNTVPIMTLGTRTILVGSSDIMRLLTQFTVLFSSGSSRLLFSLATRLDGESILTLVDGEAETGLADSTMGQRSGSLKCCRFPVRTVLCAAFYVHRFSANIARAISVETLIYITREEPGRLRTAKVGPMRWLCNDDDPSAAHLRSILFDDLGSSWKNISRLAEVLHARYYLAPKHVRGTLHEFMDHRSGQPDASYPQG
ncbi:hypothetical protein KC361_g34 [Hortaea werneckii]|nr:hypothetical protein KC361_g34 [Hortaea werneckii]